MSKAVRSMPDTVLNTVDGMVDGIYRRFVKPTHPRLTANADYAHRGSFDLEVCQVYDKLVVYKFNGLFVSKCILKELSSFLC